MTDMLHKTDPDDYHLTVYATDWCPDCVRAFRVLKQAGVRYTKIDIEEVPRAEAKMRELNGGSGKIPTLILERDAQTFCLIEPDDPDLKVWIKTHLSLSKEPPSSPEHKSGE